MSVVGSGSLLAAATTVVAVGSKSWWQSLCCAALAIAVPSLLPNGAAVPVILLVVLPLLLLYEPGEPPCGCLDTLCDGCGGSTDAEEAAQLKELNDLEQVETDLHSSERAERVRSANQSLEDEGSMSSLVSSHEATRKVKFAAALEHVDIELDAFDEAGTTAKVTRYEAPESSHDGFSARTTVVGDGLMLREHSPGAEEACM